MYPMSDMAIFNIINYVINYGGGGGGGGGGGIMSFFYNETRVGVFCSFWNPSNKSISS